ncbi:unnamed protein product [Arabidopsis thaliana]|uniref:Uncharacterized protein At2g39520 n=2 Tax=Arabidopsis thaliana TaxID=3702 RepID=O80639_ARATH|nr:uncharacterized protein AT2G39520 [Arabidopsis thaliana]AAC27843.1 hypothetical protein [Arabidopsis thaliana]AEC09690.1 hypothetical protein AT2G39520 [Arabidopsis thaliana]VYS54965.1 unnamed protein product [Arabidopsis thaliana]|eukprot:NP_181484.1 hypothetical protein AT2G39520 [Arabidopsis thaliana]
MVTLLVLRMISAITRKTPVKTLSKRSKTFNETAGGEGGGGAIKLITINVHIRYSFTMITISQYFHLVDELRNCTRKVWSTYPKELIELLRDSMVTH